MRLDGKVIIVTGAASGMGKAMAEVFAAEGAHIVVSDIHGDAAKQVVQTITENGGTALAVETNVAEETAVQQLIDQTITAYGKLDVLVNNAGIMDGMEGVADISDERWERVFSINTTAVMHAMRLVVPLFQKQGHGVILNNISIGGLNGARAGAAYTASKHAVVGLTKNTAYLYAKEGIRCNGIAPGAVETNIGQSMTNIGQSMTNIGQSMTNINEFGMGRTMLGMGLNPRTASPEEIAKLALFLVSEDSSFVNGAIVVADGGWSAY